MSGIMNMLLGARTAIAVAVDEFFNRVTLLLPGDGTNGAQNNTFLDSSTNNFTITRNGNTTQGTFSPFSQTGWSNFFDGSGDYLVTASSAALGFGTGDFTIEGWFYFTGTISTYQRPWGFSDANDNIEINGSVLRVGGTNQGTLIIGSTTIVANRWYHIALTRASGVYRLWLDGTQEGSSATNSWNSSSRQMGISAYPTGVDPITGYVSNLRVLKGTSLYSASFTPSTTPLTEITNTSLLTCQSNRFIDSSSSQIALTVNGNPSVQAFSPFAPTAAYSASTNGGSGYFDGTGDYLTAPASTNAAFAFGTGDFSIELWTYLPSVSAYGRLFTSSANNSNMDFAGGGAITYFDGGSYSGGTLVANAWQHIVVTRQSGTLRTFLNGVMQANASNSTNLSTNSQYAFAAATNGANTTQQYMAGIRVVKGGIPSAYSTSSTTNGTQIFTPPTAPLTGSESLTAGSVSLLLNFTNAGIIDATAKNDLETVGNAQISTAQSKFGGSSMYFDGTGDYLITNSSVANSAFGTGDFTVEFWLYTNAGSTTYNVIDWRPPSTQGAYFAFYLSSGVPVYYTSSADRITGGSAIPATTWTHVAISRSGTSTRMFINGTQSGSTYTDSTNYLGVANRPAIGGGGLDTGSLLNGYIDDLRVTKFARYTSNFTAPTAPFATQ
jgi:hypothetical protein